VLTPHKVINFINDLTFRQSMHFGDDHCQHSDQLMQICRYKMIQYSRNQFLFTIFLQSCLLPSFFLSRSFNSMLIFCKRRFRDVTIMSSPVSDELTVQELFYIFFDSQNCHDNVCQKSRKCKPIQSCYSYVQNNDVYFFWDTVYIGRWIDTVPVLCNKTRKTKHQ